MAGTCGSSVAPFCISPVSRSELVFHVSAQPDKVDNRNASRAGFNECHLQRGSWLMTLGRETPPFPQHAIKLISPGTSGGQPSGFIISKLTGLPHLKISVILLKDRSRTTEPYFILGKQQVRLLGTKVKINFLNENMKWVQPELLLTLSAQGSAEGMLGLADAQDTLGSGIPSSQLYWRVNDIFIWELCPPTFRQEK